MIGNRRDINVILRTRGQQEGQFWFEGSLNMIKQQYRVSTYFLWSSVNQHTEDDNQITFCFLLWIPFSYFHAFNMFRWMSNWKKIFFKILNYRFHHKSNIFFAIFKHKKKLYKAELYFDLNKVWFCFSGKTNS